MSFINSIFEKAKANLKTIAIPEYDNDYMMKAAVKAHHDQIANILLVGPTAEVQKRAEELNLDITGIRIADPEDADYTNGLLERYAALPEKVMPRSFVAKRISSPLYLAVLIEAVGDADGTLAGVNATTYEFIMAANSVIGLKPGVPTASGVLIVEAEDFDGLQGTCFGMSDGAVCISPTVEQHASIAISSCETFRAITGVEPRCAFLSYSTDGSGGFSEPPQKNPGGAAFGPEVGPGLQNHGGIPTGGAIDERVGAKKVKRPSEVAGRANVLIFPDAAACNIGSKLVLRFAKGVKQYGPLYQGFRLPILDCSRSDTDVTLYNNIALLSVLAADQQA